MSSAKGQTHIYAQEHQLYYYYNNFRGHSQKESKTIHQAIAISSVNAAGIVSTFILLYKSFRCNKNFGRTPQILSNESLLLSFQKEKITKFCKQRRNSLLRLLKFIVQLLTELSWFRSKKTSYIRPWSYFRHYFHHRPRVSVLKSSSFSSDD